jgi:ATP-dependent Clp protease ATP-binding subunit ClpX
MIGKLRCSFCGKHQDDVKKLVAGAKAFICNECVAIADRIMKETPDDPGDAPKPASWPEPPKPPRS